MSNSIVIYLILISTSILAAVLLYRILITTKALLQKRKCVRKDFDFWVGYFSSISLVVLAIVAQYLVSTSNLLGGPSTDISYLYFADILLFSGIGLFGFFASTDEISNIVGAPKPVPAIIWISWLNRLRIEAVVDRLLWYLSLALIVISFIFTIIFK